MGRAENVMVFQDTDRQCRGNEALIAAVKASSEKQVLTKEGQQIPSAAGKHTYEKPAGIVVSKKRSFEAAAGYPGKKVCVLNFASASNPGGGVINGSSAQEEALCRCSTLYFNLNTPEMWKGFYRPHREAKDPLHNDDCIYTPGVVVFKTDTDTPEMMEEPDWYKVNVITCAAPNLRERPSNGMNPGEGMKKVSVTPEKLRRLHEKRMRRVLDVAALNGDEVVILGAFGCGAFRNDPNVVAEAMKTVVTEYRNVFQTIEFAVYCSPRDDSNYRIFKQKLDRL